MLEIKQRTNSRTLPPRRDRLAELMNCSCHQPTGDWARTAACKHAALTNRSKRMLCDKEMADRWFLLSFGSKFWQTEQWVPAEKRNRLHE